jgi:membrane protease YdiL (CAAX protease family)
MTIKEKKMENKNYPKIKNAILLCLLFIGIQLGTGLILGVIIGLLGLGTDSLVYGLGTILLNLLSFGLVIFIGYKRTHKSFNEVFMFNNVSLNNWVSIIVFMFGFVIVSSEIDNILQYFLPMPSFLQDVFGSILVNKYIAVSILLVGIVPAFVEEMLFRGVILNGFKGNYSQKKAIIISSLLFGIIHLNPWQFVTAFIIGIISAWICLKIESIILSIYIHLFNNMVTVFVLRFKDIIPIKGFNTAYSEQTFQPLWFDIIGVVLTVAGILLFIKNNKSAKNGT